MTDMILYNGPIYTMEAPGARAEAIAIEGNRIRAVGRLNDVLPLANADTRMIDLGGRCALPGFNDTHCHVVLTGMESVKVCLRGVRSIEELIGRMRRFIEARRVPEGTWVVGSGYDHLLFDAPRQPNRADLDRVSTRHPIMVDRICGHIGAANSLALARVGFDADTVIEGEGGIMEKDASGQLSGVLVETARDVMANRMPKRDAAALAPLIQGVFEEASSYGVTSMQTDDLEAAPIGEIMAAYRRLKDEGRATVRIWEEVQCPRPAALRRFLALGMRTGDGDGFFKIGNIKIITDGSLGARTALMRADYADAPGARGVAVYTQADLDALIMEAHLSGMQVACHAIGDGAVAQCVHAMAAARTSDGIDRRNRIVHCQFADDALLDRMAAEGICADIQPAFVPSDYLMAEARMGARCGIGYRWRSMARRGIHMGGGSDSPVETFNPIWGIDCAVNRTDRGSLPAGGWRPGEALSVWDAVRLYTSEAAYLTFEEGEKGMLKPGMLADIAVLDRDIFAVPHGEIRHIRNVMTVMDGKIVYTA
ncbi:MAG: amidohydrolase [Clostridia bacterium]|nr:amidohydrolase [Clostridia bacterium]